MAAKEILSDIIIYCTDDNMIESQISRILDPELLCLYEKKKIDKNDFDSKLELDNSNLTNKSKKILSKRAVPQEVPFNNKEHVLYICKGTIFCRKNNHEIVSATGILTSLNGNQVKINVNYCKSCNIYFLGLSEYKYYKKIYGILLGNIAIKENTHYSDNRYDNLADESILHIMGYTVNKNDNLTNDQRRKILSYLMDREIISKYRIIEYLQFFIDSSKYRYNMKLANQKWSEDLIWVRSYNIDVQSHYSISEIKKWH